MAIGLVNLPDELLLEITNRLDRFALLALSQVCRVLLHFSSSSTYWHNDYVPAFLPIAPISKITAAQFRKAAIRSQRTRRILMNPKSTSRPGSTPNQYYPQKRITTAGTSNHNNYPFHQTIGSRFLFEIQGQKIVFWDAFTGRVVIPISQLSQAADSSWSSDISPFAISRGFGFGRGSDDVLCDTVSSICVSTDQIRIAICWNAITQSQTEVFLERVTITFKTFKSSQKINSSRQNLAHNRDGGGDSRVGRYARKAINVNDVKGINGNGVKSKSGAESDQVYAEFQWETPLPFYILNRLNMQFSTRLRMTQRYVVLILKLSGDDNSYVRLYDCDNPLRPSYIYHEYRPRPTLEVMCTPYHVVFVRASFAREIRNGKNYIHIRTIPLQQWFSDSITDVDQSSTANLLEAGWVREDGEGSTLRFPRALGSTDIQNRFRKEYQESTLKIRHAHHDQFYAIGSTDTTVFDSSTFTIFIKSSLVTVPEPKMEYYVVSIPPIPSPKAGTILVGHTGHPEDAADMGQDCIRVVDHGYHTPNLSVLYINTANGSKAITGEEKGKRTIPSYSSNNPYTFIYHLREDKKIGERRNFLISKGRSINWKARDRGFDAHAGIAVMEGGVWKNIIWYS